RTASTVASAPVAASSDNILPIAVSIVCVVLGGAGALFLYTNRNRGVMMETSGESASPTGTIPRPRGALARETQSTDIVLEQIAELGQDFEANKIPKEDYDRQRAELKARLSEVMRGKEEQP